MNAHSVTHALEGNAINTISAAVAVAVCIFTHLFQVGSLVVCQLFNTSDCPTLPFAYQELLLPLFCATIPRVDSCKHCTQASMTAAGIELAITVGHYFHNASEFFKQF